MSRTAVDVDGLSRAFGGVVAVEELSFEVHEGELFGLVGPDGAGKTTTLRMLAGVLPPTEGDARVFGHSVAREPEAMKHDIAYMPQRFGLYTDLTVRENLDFYADLFGVGRSEREGRLERLYRFSGLEPFEDRLAGNLSGGMKQKLGLSCALIHDPKLLLLDEPTFGVDPISRRDLWLIVHEMVARGVTVVVSTAYMDEAERFDRVALLDGGRMTALDSPDVLRRRLADRLLAVRGVPVRAARDAARGVPGVAGASIFGDRVHVVTEEGGAGSAVEARLRRGLERHGLAGAEIGPAAPTMEDVFMHLARREEAPHAP